MLHVCCIRAGEAFSPAYVSNLYDMVRRNLEEGFSGRFVCFTDQPEEFPGVETAPLPYDLPGWWSKLALFRDGLFPKGDRVLFLDLDTLITGPIDKLASYDGPFAILRDFYRPNGLQSSVMAWTSGECPEIWDEFVLAGCPTNDPGGDQAWIEAMDKSPINLLQDIFPGMFVSYKLCRGIPDQASVVVFHGKPRPHEVTDGWVPKVWKQGGITRAELTAICNTEIEKLLTNVRSSSNRNLEWFDLADEHDGHLAIIGGGPSLVDSIEEIKWRQSIGQHIWALNNSGKFLEKHCIKTDVQIILDARPENASFISKADKYYIASQAAPEVFDALSEKSVTLWHINSPGMAELLQNAEKPAYMVGAGTTVGINSIALAFLKGYRKIHLYGFDSSYRDVEHHAYSQTINDAEKVAPALYGDKEYICANWMIGQAQEFMDLVPTLSEDGCIITVHGYGLLPDIAKDMSKTMTPAQHRANEIIKRLNGSIDPRGAEIGVFTGRMSRALLSHGIHLTMVDSWEGSGKAYHGNSGDWHAGLTQEVQEGCFEETKRRVAFAGDRARIIRKRSFDAAMDEPDNSLDFVFLDDDHSYEGCRAGIAAWERKVKPGGWLCGHDYENNDFPKFGVTQAVNEYAKTNNLTLEIGENYCWFIKKETA